MSDRRTCTICNQTDHHSPTCPEMFWPGGLPRGVLQNPPPLPLFSPAKREAKLLEVASRGGISPESVGERMAKIFSGKW